MYQEESSVIADVDEQLDGMMHIEQLHPLRILAAQHRGTSAQWLSGNDQALQSLKSIEGRMDEAIRQAKTVFSNNLYSQKNTQAFERTIKQWPKLQHTNLKAMNVSTSFVQHTNWIKSLTSLIDYIASERGLVLNDHIDHYMLMELVVFDLPALQELLGQIRGVGAGVATAGGFTPDSFVQVSGLYKNISENRAGIAKHYDFIKKSNPSMAASLKDHMANMDVLLLQFKDITQSKLLDPDEPLLSGEEYFRQGSIAIKGVVAAFKQGLKVYYTNLDGYRSLELSYMIVVLSIFGVLMLFGWYLFLCLKISVYMNASLTQNMADNLQQGVLTGDFKSESQDELGKTVHHLNKGFQQIRKVVSQVRDNSGALSVSSSELQGVSSQVNELGHAQKSKVEIIVTAATELAATAKEVASHCSSAASETQSAQEKSVDGAKRSQASANVIRELAQGIRKAGDEISQLAQQAASISTVIDVIKAIAEQTNLLALNAAIEAARAGEQGRGFAVVADEVRTLANRTQQSTNEIEATISSLQTVAEQAVGAMESACEQADIGEKEAMEIGEVLADIERSVDQVSSLIQQVATAGTEQAGAAEEIAQNIQAVDDSSSDLVEKAQSVASIANNVDTGSQSLENTVKQFKV